MKKGTGEKQEPVFELIKNMSKAEKRNFKLYATRLSDNREAKFMRLFECLEAAEEYDEQQILACCPVSKQQLPNMKAHLYKQILTSIRMLDVRHSETLQLREQLDFARILYDKGLYRQCAKLVERIKQHATLIEDYSANLDAVEIEGKIELLNASRDMAWASNLAHKRVLDICSQLENNTELSNTFTRVYALYLQLGYARTQKDLDLIEQYFRPRLEAYAGREHTMSFHELFYFYQAKAWYYYIRHNFVQCYRYSCKWVGIFDDNPRMKHIMYDEYMKGVSQILDGLYMMRKYRHFAYTLAGFEKELGEIGRLNTNAYISGHRTLYLNKMNKCFIEGSFAEGIGFIGDVENFVENYSEHLDIQFKMLTNYKIACLYFGQGDYPMCMEYLARVTTTKDPQLRRDIQCYARMLNLIASYEAGIDHNLDYQIRSVYSFLVKMNDMHAVQTEMLSFLKRLNTIYAGELKNELKVLYSRLKPYENHPYERRTFYYLDILSWLESKITGQTLGEIIRRKFRELTA